ncbi:MAG: YncE family protein [Rhodanobacteraceae bacterium]
MNHLKFALVGVLTLSVAVAVQALATTPKYTLVLSTPLGLPNGFDYVHYDVANHRVYASHESQITVVNGDNGKVVGRIFNIQGAHGVVTIPSLNRGYADNGRSGEVTVFDLKTLKILGRIPTDKDSDGMAYDDTTGKIAVVNGDSRNVSLIDAKSGKRLINIPLDGGPEGLIADGHGKLYINIEDKRQIVRIDLATDQITARWPIPSCEAPHGMAVDSVSHRLFSSCRNSRLLVVDADNGQMIKTLPLGRGSDTVVFDPARKLVFSSNRDGTLSVIAEKSAADFEFLGNVPTAPGAKTMAEDPNTGRVFVTTADVLSKEPPHDQGKVPEFGFKPGTVKMLMFDPVAAP